MGTGYGFLQHNFTMIDYSLMSGGTFQDVYAPVNVLEGITCYKNSWTGFVSLLIYILP